METNGKLPSISGSVTIPARRVGVFIGDEGWWHPNVQTPKERTLRNELAKQDRLIQAIRNRVRVGQELDEIKELLRLYDNGE